MGSPGATVFSVDRMRIKAAGKWGKGMKRRSLLKAGVAFAVPGVEGEENFVGDSEIIALGGASNETKDRPLG